MADSKLLDRISNEITPSEARRLKLPTNRKQQLWDIIKLHFFDLVKINLLTLVLCLPLLLVVLFIPTANNLYISSRYDFLGNILIGFPGSADSMLAAQIEAIQQKYMFVLILVPAIILTGPAMAGMFYCLRNYVWGQNVTIRVDYWKGIKMGWKQYTLTTFLFAVFIGIGMTNIYMYKLASLQDATNAWVTISFVISIIMIFLLAAISLYMLPQMAMYDMKYIKLIKNSMILSVAMLPLTIGILILTAIPFLLGWLLNIGTIINMIIVFVGIAILALMWVVYVQYVLDKSVNKVSKNQAYNRGIYVVKKPEEGEDSSTNSKGPKKVQYVNPKKKKKKVEPQLEQLSETFNRAELMKHAEDKEKFLDELDEIESGALDELDDNDNE